MGSGLAARRSQGLYVEPAIGQEVLGAQVVRGLDHLRGELEAARPAGGVVVGQGVRPVEERAEAADGDADLIGSLADGLKLFRAVPRGKVVIEVVVQFDPVETLRPWPVAGIPCRFIRAG